MVDTFKVNTSTKIEFQTMDAQKMSFDDEMFDTVICLNVIDRVPEPEKVLVELMRITRKSGYLLITDPYDWSEQYTVKEKQISNIKDVYTEETWEFVVDKDVDFELYSNPRKSIKYRDHLLLLRKRQANFFLLWVSQ